MEKYASDENKTKNRKRNTKKIRYNKKDKVRTMHDGRTSSSNIVESNTDQLVIAEKTKEKLKSKITEWLDYDDKIKMLNEKLKNYKDTKKKYEEIIIKMITDLGIENTKIEVHDDDNNLRGRVYRYRSVTKGSLKENIIKDALMEAIRDEKKVIQLIKKINDKRPIQERYYLKRTKDRNNKN